MHTFLTICSLALLPLPIHPSLFVCFSSPLSSCAHKQTPTGTAQWLNVRSWCNGHHNLRCCPRVLPAAGSVAPGRLQGDYGRLARRLTNTAVGVVVGGGGARGIAHFGVIQALEEAGGCNACNC